MIYEDAAPEDHDPSAWDILPWAALDEDDGDDDGTCNDEDDDNGMKRKPDLDSQPFANPFRLVKDTSGRLHSRMFHKKRNGESWVWGASHTWVGVSPTEDMYKNAKTTTNVNTIQVLPGYS